MANSSGFVQASWGPRAETPGELSARVLDFVTELEPFFAFVESPLGILRGDEVDTDLSGLEQAIVDGTRTDDRGNVWEGRGYAVTLFASDEQLRSVTISIGGGATADVRRVVHNSVSIRVSDAFPLDAFRGFAETSVIGIVDAFEPAFAWVADRPQLAVNPRSGTRPRFGPVTWISDVLPPLPAKLPGATLDRHGDGTLVRLVPKPGEHLWTDEAPTKRVVDALAKAEWAPSLSDLNA